MLHCNVAKLASARPFGSPARCPNCGDRMVAPVHSEFVECGEIRHHWECEACGEVSTSFIRLCTP